MSLPPIHCTVPSWREAASKEEEERGSCFQSCQSSCSWQPRRSRETRKGSHILSHVVQEGIRPFYKQYDSRLPRRVLGGQLRRKATGLNLISQICSSFQYMLYTCLIINCYSESLLELTTCVATNCKNRKVGLSIRLWLQISVSWLAYHCVCVHERC